MIQRLSISLGLLMLVLVAGPAAAGNCAPRLDSFFQAAETMSLPGESFIEPQDAQIGTCPGGVYESWVTYYSDATKTTQIGSCHNTCQRTQVCEGSTSRYISFARHCCGL
jgi:hypothetical protein